MKLYKNLYYGGMNFPSSYPLSHNPLQVTLISFLLDIYLGDL